MDESQERKVKLTDERIKRIVCRDDGRNQDFWWDTEAKGLAVRVTRNGTKSFIFRGKLNGKVIVITIGDVRTWAIYPQDPNPNNARTEARRLQVLIDAKIDPRHAKAEEIQAAEAKRVEQASQQEAEHVAVKRRDALVSGAWGAYLDYQKDKMTRAHIEKGKKWGPRHLLDHERLAQAGGEKKKRGAGVTKPGPIYPLLKMRMVEISADALTEWQRTEAETRANNARQAFEMFRAFWRWCSTRPEYSGVVDVAAVESKELRDEVPSRKSKRFDVLDSNHLPAWFKAVRGLDNPVVRAYLQTLMLTGARREEIAAMRWADVDFRFGGIWVKDKVAEEGRKIPLTPYVATLLAELKRRNETPPPKHRILNGKKIETDLSKWKPSPWVFFSKAAKDGKLAEPRIPHNRALSAAGLPPLSIHGLRRTFKSMSEWVEMPVGIVAQIMGHKPSATAEKHYTERPLDLLALWHGKYEAWILNKAGVDFVGHSMTVGILQSIAKAKGAA